MSQAGLALCLVDFCQASIGEGAGGGSFFKTRTVSFRSQMLSFSVLFWKKRERKFRCLLFKAGNFEGHNIIKMFGVF